MKLNKKVMVIGLDGDTFDLIKPGAEEGKLLTFKLMDEGILGHHRGYDYRKDIKRIEKYFRIQKFSYVPIGFLFGLNPAVKR